MGSSEVSIVGLGKLGAPLAAVLASKIGATVAIDVNERSVDAINEGRAPVGEPGLQVLLDEVGGRLRASTDYAAIRETDATFIIVPTPSDEAGGFSLRYVLQACEGIGAQIAAKSAYHLVVLTSTVLPGATGTHVLEALERASGCVAGKDFGLCYSPEFVALGSVIQDLLHPDFVLIGEHDPEAGDRLEAIHAQIIENRAPIVRMNTVNAEVTKLAVNTFVTMKISFANTIARMCEQISGADADIVTSALGRDSRIGGRYLKGAMGYGGPCFPRDNRALAYVASTVGAPAELASATDSLNREQVPRIVGLIESRVPRGAPVAVLGLAYKPDTDVVEQSQGLLIAAALATSGYEVVAYDPAALETAREHLSGVRLAASAQEAVEGVQLTVIATPWEEFAKIDFRSPAISPKMVVLDCWRMLDATSIGEAVEYVTLGRSWEGSRR